MKPINALKNMWLRGQTSNKRLKQNALTKDADGVQVFSVLYMKQLEAISQQKYY